MPTLAQLKRMCQARGIEVIDSKERAPYLNALRTHYLSRDYPSGLPYTELSPMLCYSYADLHPKEQQAIWKDGNNWIAQPKLNGCRIILHFVKDVGVFAHSRTVNQSTFRRQEYTDHLLFRGSKPPFTATVDCEALVEQPINTGNGVTTASSLHSTAVILKMNPETALRIQREQAPLRFFVLDLVKWGDKDLKSRELAERFSYFTDFKDALKSAGLNPYFEFPEICFRAKRLYMERILENGGEGVVLKNLGSHYEASSSRNRYGWVKCKREIAFFGFVSGFEQGRSDSRYEHQVATLLFSIRTEAGPRMVGKCSNLIWNFRKQISIYDRATGKVRLDPEVYGRVARLGGFEFSARAARLVHPYILHWCTDMRMEQCVYDEAEFQALRQGAVRELLRKVEASCV